MLKDLVQSGTYWDGVPSWSVSSRVVAVGEGVEEEVMEDWRLKNEEIEETLASGKRDGMVKVDNARLRNPFYVLFTVTVLPWWITCMSLWLILGGWMIVAGLWSLGKLNKTWGRGWVLLKKN